MKKFSYGFTLIELLVVIAILGVLAGGILVAINPLEQLARGRDAGRKTTVDQLGKAVQSYYTTQSATYPTADTFWVKTIKEAGELKIVPTNPNGGSKYKTGCGQAGSDENGYCYQTDNVDAIVYARAESDSSHTAAGCASGQQAWIVWSSQEGKTGLTCTTDSDTDPLISVTNLK